MQDPLNFSISSDISEPGSVDDLPSPPEQDIDSGLASDGLESTFEGKYF